MTPRVLCSFLAVTVLVPFAIFGCDQLKKDSAVDAAPPVVATPATTAAPTAAPTDTTPPTPTTAAPLGSTPAPTATTTTSAHPTPTAKTDGGAPADGGKPGPAPTPTLAIPTAIPGFDAGAFKPPPGFPSALPTFPPPPK